jgi:hypothetical protein
MPGLTFSNESISYDEGIHTDFSCLLFTHLKRRRHPDTVLKIISEAVLDRQVHYVGISNFGLTVIRRCFACFPYWHERAVGVMRELPPI